MQLVYTGSVKDLYTDEKGLLFQYSNRYSIFDWGEMPDQIPHKGEALASMATSFFEHLKNKGISSHYVGTGAKKNEIRVQSVKVIRPPWENGTYDYTEYETRPTNCLVPLEVIFRRHLGQGNSLEGRLKKNPEYLADLGLETVPTGATSFNPALVEFSTKLESSDRYLTRAEIHSMDIVSQKELEAMRTQTRQVTAELEKLFASFGVKLWDGKVEFAFGNAKSADERELLLVDSIGPDELRLTYEGLPLSKEFLRQIYGDSSWSQAVKKSKDLAKERGTPDWKKICSEELKQNPTALTTKQIEVSSLLYQALANEVAAYTGHAKPFAPEMNLKLWHQQAQACLTGN
jgi:Phosphoribosylaminoimidazolesuccinocarboxamide (SAICAR) synthase